MGLQFGHANHLSPLLNNIIQPCCADTVSGHLVSPQAVQDQPLCIDQELPIDGGLGQAIADGHNPALRTFTGSIEHVAFVLLDISVNWLFIASSLCKPGAIIKPIARRSRRE